MTDPQYEAPTIREVVDIIDLLRPWEHGFTLVETPSDPVLGLSEFYCVVCDCGWRTGFSDAAEDHIRAYQRHVGYEPE